ncbi:helix-turn-helix transcriptional regulator [Sphingomonas sp. PAMC 26605]|uniref:helix-turn-helix transcriptional regulator n=1 Tax=Sphingomonas sp. PAMC 26605 TaxID=1112214 RepID=UPI00026CCA6F|nr:AraC family transcriptional regulator [Sphingomonas sp. PAMC 26605]
MRQRIDVSPEMVALLGTGPIDDTTLEQPLVLTFRLADATVTLGGGDTTECELVLLVTETACQRVFGLVPAQDGSVWHLPSAIRAIALAILECALAEPARATLRLAKSIELLCAVMEALREAGLVPADGCGHLSERDSQRIVAAQRMIDEQWREKLTLNGIARACGLNRSKLTRGFRSMFACTVSDAITERRLGGARHLLLASDLPISAIGYRCGYLNNASFTRAFSRRFGEAPSHVRAHRIAA